MSINDQKKNSHSGFFTFVVLLLVLYPLSIGPMAWLDFHSYLPDPIKTAAEAFYYPIKLLHDHSETGRKLVLWYMGLFLNL